MNKVYCKKTVNTANNSQQPEYYSIVFFAFIFF